MPIYEFILPETGQIVEVFREVNDRDTPPQLVRRTAPSRIGLVVGATPEPTMAQTLRNAYHEVELREGSRFKSSMSKTKIKTALDNDRNN